ncbi:IS3 family transposase [Bacillus cereus]|uniref:IS3 family transposase n=2 Tax=Bacillus cereus TaxID=1396 RepID=UPI000BF3791F|nr:hypothetical protein COK23_24595 [Bacillus cereus]PGK43489.1 hypothetical protein CN909_18585 [Bacillus cereus]PGT82964.1 hypothetical protein COD18_29415 [Bacillus cereus]
MKRMVIKFFMLYYSEHKKTASQLLDISNDWEAVFSIKKYKYSLYKKSLTKKIFMILECHKKLKSIYGYRRVQIWPKATYNLHFNHKRIQRLMRELGIKAIIRRKRPY